MLKYAVPLCLLIGWPVQAVAQDMHYGCSAYARGDYGFVAVGLEFSGDKQLLEGSARWKTERPDPQWKLEHEATLSFSLSSTDKRLVPDGVHYGQDVPWVPNQRSDIVLRLDNGVQYRRTYADERTIRRWRREKYESFGLSDYIVDPAFVTAFWRSGSIEVELIQRDGLATLKQSYALPVAAAREAISALDADLRAAVAKGDLSQCRASRYPPEVEEVL